MSVSEIKVSLGKQRLRFSKKQIVFYLMLMVNHQHHKKTFKSLYFKALKKNKINISYQAFMKNIGGLCPLFKLLFKSFNKTYNIKSSQLFNIVDTSLISIKQSKSIQQKDFDQNKVTVRKEKKRNVHTNHKHTNQVKVYICGYKALVFLNRRKQITHAEILNINSSDQNVLKQPLAYMARGLIQGFLLADRGFNNKEVRKRLQSIAEDENLQQLPKTKLISPFHYKEQQKDLKLNKKQKRLYKRRWNIETVFQKLKDQYQEYKLDLTGCRNYALQEAKYYISLIQYNLSTIK